MGKTRSLLPQYSPSIPTLFTFTAGVTTPCYKAEALNVQLFLPIPVANLSDIPFASYLLEMPSQIYISKEVLSVSRKSQLYKLRGNNSTHFCYIMSQHPTYIFP